MMDDIKYLFTKQCETCKKQVPVNKFAKNGLLADGLCSSCVDCAGEEDANWFSLRVAMNSMNVDIAAACIENKDMTVFFGETQLLKYMDAKQLLITATLMKSAAKQMFDIAEEILNNKER